MPSADNREKVMHGLGMKRSLSSAIEELELSGAVIQRVSRPAYGYLDMCQTQFKATEELTFADGSKAIVYTTNSIRSDRVKEQQWDAYNIKRIDRTINYAWLVVPDDEALLAGQSVRRNITSGDYFTAIDDILTIQMFYDEVFSRFSETINAGAMHDIAGNSFEETFESILSDRDNLERFNGDTSCVGYRFDVFRSIMEKVGIKPLDVFSITATRDIPRLPTGGKAKTDVAASLQLTNGDTRLVTFSLKNTSASAVSVHEYDANAFSTVLDPSNSELRRLLYSFQNAGSASGMPTDDQARLTAILRPLRMKLDLWVLGGIGTPNSSRLQTVDYLVVKHKTDNSIDVHELQEYCSAMEQKNDGSSGFGTIFSWTYPSKRRGKAIQLKGKFS